MSDVMVSITGDPIAQPRHKQGRIKHGKKKGCPISYLANLTDGSPHPVIAYKEAIAVKCKTTLPSAWERAGAFHLDVTFVMRRAAVCKGKWAHRRPDLDNLVKAVCDAIKGIVWDDDCQMVRLTAQKLSVIKGDRPHTTIHVSRL